MSWISFLLGFAIALGLVGVAIGLVALAKAKTVEGNPSLPYWVRNGLDERMPQGAGWVKTRRTWD